MSAKTAVLQAPPDATSGAVQSSILGPSASAEEKSPAELKAELLTIFFRSEQPRLKGYPLSVHYRPRNPFLYTCHRSGGGVIVTCSLRLDNPDFKSILKRIAKSALEVATGETRAVEVRHLNEDRTYNPVREARRAQDSQLADKYSDLSDSALADLASQLIRDRLSGAWRRKQSGNAPLQWKEIYSEAQRRASERNS